MSDHKYKEGDRVKLNPNMEWSNISFYNSKTFSILYEKTFKILNVRTDEPKGDNGKVF